MPFAKAPAQLAGKDAVGASLRHRTPSGIPTHLVIPAYLVIPAKAGIQRLVLDSGSSLHSAWNDEWRAGWWGFGCGENSRRRRMRREIDETIDIGDIGAGRGRYFRN